MKLKELEQKLKSLGIEYKLDEPLAGYTTFKIGGPADILAFAKTKKDLINAIESAKKNDVPYTILGGGSNILISDKGIRGLVIRNHASEMKIHKEVKEKKALGGRKEKIKARLDELKPKEYYTFKDLDYEESDAPVVKVTIESGAPLANTIMRLIREGVTGLQWFGGIPGTIGGAVYNNIHGGTHFLSEYIDKVRILDTETMEEKVLEASECDFAYDYSRFHGSGEIILSVDLNLLKGDTKKAKYVYIEWTRRKKLQPQKSAGCVWQNISQKQQKELNLESNSWGYIIDQVLQLKGTKIGGAQISKTHAAFIENVDNAKAEDVIALMELIKKQAQKKIGITPKSEVFLVGEE